MADDQEAHVAAIREDMADYMLSGDAKVKVKGYVGAGITNHANTNQVDLSASGLNIDLTTSTPDESSHSSPVRSPNCWTITTFRRR
jgi:hypothetical protein